jgi:HAD superfamily hydrolase (TIGR01549 family)
MRDQQTVTAAVIMFDFGGCLDTNGIHNRTLLFDALVEVGLVGREARARFDDAYTRVDAAVNEQGLALGMGLEAMNRLYLDELSRALGLQGQSGRIAEVHHLVCALQKRVLDANRGVLARLSGDFTLGVVSNFSGNLTIILDESGIRRYLSFVIESYYAGVSKPSPAIFERALEACGRSARECVFVGDNPERDLAPARALGMKTVLVSTDPEVSQQRDRAGAGPVADAYISEVSALLDLVHRA